MKNKIILFSLCLIFCCKMVKAATGFYRGTDTTGLYPPVETQPRVGKQQQPAFEGQTRIAGVRTTTPYTVKTVATGLHSPFGMAFLPDGRIIYTEKPGSIHIISSTGVIGPAIGNIPKVRFEGDGGLMDIKLDPDFAKSRLIFWSFSEPVEGGSLTSVGVGRLSNDETSLENVHVIFRAAPAYSGPLQNGSRLLFDNKGLLYLSTGCRYDSIIRQQAQVKNSYIGKIVRINKDGTAAAGNPFEHTAGVFPEIYALGTRNPEGLAFNPETGQLWESDNGPQGGDEINIIQAGANYGWPAISYGLEYSGAPVNGTGLTGKEGMEQPIYYWDPCIAPSGITFYTGSLIPEWRNNLFVAALRGTHIVRLIIKNNRVTGEERLLENEHQRFRNVVQGPDGALYVMTDGSDSKIYRLGK